MTVILLALAAVNAIVITWATVLDNRHASALARALGATPREVSTALAAAQVLPALLGAVLGIFPGGFAAVRRHHHDHRRRQRPGPPFPGPGSCSPWCWPPCSQWPRSPLFPPASAAAAP